MDPSPVPNRRSLHGRPAGAQTGGDAQASSTHSAAIICARLVDVICISPAAASARGDAVDVRDADAHLEAIFAAALALFQERGGDGGAASATSGTAEDGSRALIIRLLPAFFEEQTAAAASAGLRPCVPPSFAPRLAAAVAAGFAHKDGPAAALLALCRLPHLAAAMDATAAATTEAALRRAVSDRCHTVRKRAAHLVAVLGPETAAGGRSAAVLGRIGWDAAQWRAVGDVLEAAEDTSAHLVAAAWAAALPTLAPRPAPGGSAALETAAAAAQVVERGSTRPSPCRCGCLSLLGVPAAAGAACRSCCGLLHSDSAAMVAAAVA